MATKLQYQTAVIDNSDPITASGLLQTAVTFGVSDTTSSALFCGGVSPTGVYLPASWLAGNLSFTVSKNPNGPFVALKDFDGGAFAITTSAGAQCIPLLPAMFNSVGIYLKLVSSVTQSGAPTVEFALAPIFQGIHG